MKIGIYGGSFNPVHNGHVNVVELVLKENLVDEIWLIPCKTHAFNKDLISAEHRLKMLELAFENYDDVKINLTEINSNKISYTSDTIKTLKNEYPHDFYFIAGFDALNDLDEWHDCFYLKDSLKFIGVQRQGYSLDVTDFNLEKIIFSDRSFSSTNIRRRISENKSVKGLVNSKVEKYIVDNQLYFLEFKNPASTVDLIVPYEDGLILIKRKNAPYKGFWALPGGFLDYGKETLEQAGVRELEEETSLKTEIESLRLVGVYSEPSRDPRGQVISHVYEVLNVSGVLKANDDATHVKSFKSIPKNLAFDHHKIICDYNKIK